jgi:uncharacterized spore protein YtfJ
MAQNSELIADVVPTQKEANRFMEQMLEATSLQRVFGEPVHHGDYAAIPASEITLAMGYGYGGGQGFAVGTGQAGTAGAETTDNGPWGGGGGGGGGTVLTRPVAVIEIGPRGVRVEPVVDPTKIALAFFTTLGAMAMMWNRMRRASEE